MHPRLYDGDGVIAGERKRSSGSDEPRNLLKLLPKCRGAPEKPAPDLRFQANQFYAPSDPRVALLRDTGGTPTGDGGIRYHLQIIGEVVKLDYKGNTTSRTGFHRHQVLSPPVTGGHVRRFRRKRRSCDSSRAGQPQPTGRSTTTGIVQISPPNSSPLDKVALPFTVLEYVHAPRSRRHSQPAWFPGSPGRTRASCVSGVRAQLRAAQKHRSPRPQAIEHSTPRSSTNRSVKVTDFGLAKLEDFNAQKTAMLAGASLATRRRAIRKRKRAGDAAHRRLRVRRRRFECLTGLRHFPPARDNRLSSSRNDRGARPSLARRRIHSAPSSREPARRRRYSTRSSRSAASESDRPPRIGSRILGCDRSAARRHGKLPSSASAVSRSCTNRSPASR